MSIPALLSRRTGRAEYPADAGFTLVELVVTMGLTVLVLGLLIPLLSVASSAAQLGTNTELATAAGAHALEAIETEVGSASTVCLLATTGSPPSPGACPAPVVGSPANGAEVTTTAFSPASPRVLQWWLSGGSGGAPGVLMSEQWRSGQPASATTSVLAGSSLPGSCSIAPGANGLFSLRAAGSGMSVLSISLVATCGSGPHAASIPMSTSIAALDSAPTGS